MYYIVEMSSLNQTASLETKENLLFHPNGEYKYMNIFHIEQEANSYFERVNFYLNNYSMFSHALYHEKANKEKYDKKSKFLYKSLLNSNFDDVEELFKNEFSKYVKNLLDVELTTMIKDNFGNHEFHFIYSDITKITTKQKQFDTLIAIINNKKKSERQQHTLIPHNDWLILT